MKFQCQLCSCAIHDVKPWMLGKKIVCPNCSKNIVLPSNPFGVGRIIGDFIIDEKIGEGSIGTVYLAHQASLDRKVALKILSENYTNSKGMATFLSEARAAAKLSHPNLIKCLAVNEEQGICFMAMNYINGLTLKQKIKNQGKIEVDEALHITQQVAEALHCAWTEERLIHRDVKPENIMINDDGIVQLADLGLAMPEGAWHEGMEISGSPSYMSPEQFTGEKLDTRSDIYSLGVTLYQMLSGRLPFMGKTLNTVARQHFKEYATSLNKIIPSIPRSVSDLVDKMMAKRPDERFKDMDELLHQIWTIRQSTAPEKELVPSVHTVTLKRLDYDLQLQSKARKIQIQMAEHIERSKTEIYVKIIAFTVPLLILAMVLFIAISNQNKNKVKAGFKVIENLEAMLADDDVSLSSLNIEFERAKASLAMIRDKIDPTVWYRFSLCEQKIENIKLMERNKVLETQASSLALRLHDLEVKFQDSNIKANELSEKDSKLKQFESRIQSLERELKKERESVQVLKKNIALMNERNFTVWCDDLRVRIAFMLKNGRFQEAYALLKISAKDLSPAQEKWIAEKKTEIELVEKLFNSIENSAQRYSGLRLKEGIIKEISGATAVITSNSGAIENIPWRNLSIDSLKAITPPDVINSSGEKLSYHFSLLNGRFSDAVAVFSLDEEAKDTMLAVRKYSFDNIRYIIATDKKRAASRIEDFLRDFASTEGIDKLKNDLNQMLKE